MISQPTVAIVHDYLTQRGGAERVVLALSDAFPEASIQTSIYDPRGTYPEFMDRAVEPSPLNRVPVFRRDHRLALPFLAQTFSSMSPSPADVLICSSSGWAHGAPSLGRKLVYCYSPPRWLYQTSSYTGGSRAQRAAVRVLGPSLRRWDQRAAQSADTYLTLSRAVRDSIRAVYGIDAEVVHPPVLFGPNGPSTAVENADSDYFLCVARLLPYKNVRVVAEAFRDLPDRRLIVVGKGPLLNELRRDAPQNVSYLGGVDAPQLRWLYSNCSAVIAASYEDYGLTPLEGLAFGKPSIALRYGGFLDTIIDGRTGVLIASPEPDCVRQGVRDFERTRFEAADLQSHLERFLPGTFAATIRRIVAELAA